ncbi:NUMOD4 motif-containing HNH endonuclease [Pseudomonas fontis]|uniref:NUMOD4 motif-containing HNH endonuclease n=1 Tax=Pseudomonas fontis TaxID=2942633 RepID=A0ABT5NLR4_9PSED|nr:NUMOD4 motif-containing HNH endonuclease [Pseudomonas fontis]MDD0974850.1 NUMOD4 motif-containing HNH endonuclease [Pseudomonas fontis]MDD0989291.1 NUMOD4 motif-containing HNH endonuclease [Pseudomonas fontis]
MSEIWIESKTLAGRYMVSSLGRAKRMAHVSTGVSGVTKSYPERLIQRAKSQDYPRIILKVNGKAKAYLVHRLVAEMFLPNPDSLPCINHKDGDKSNPHPENLEWCTHQENMAHAAATGLSDCAVPVQSSKQGSGMWFPSLESACRHTGVSKPCICAAAKKKQKTAGGMEWGYAAPGVVFDDLLGEVAA